MLWFGLRYTLVDGLMMRTADVEHQRDEKASEPHTHTHVRLPLPAWHGVKRPPLPCLAFTMALAPWEKGVLGGLWSVVLVRP